MDRHKTQTCMHTDDPKLVKFEKWAVRLSDLLGVKATETDRVVWFKGENVVEVQEPNTKRLPFSAQCDRYAWVHLAERPWTFGLGSIQCKGFWSVAGELTARIQIKPDAKIGDVARNYDEELTALKLQMKQALAALLANEEPSGLESKQEQIAAQLQEKMAKTPSPFCVRGLTLNLGVPDYQEKARARTATEAQWEMEVAEALVKARKLTAEQAQEFSGKLAALRLSQLENERVVKPLVETITGKVDEYIAVKLSKDPEALRQFAETKYGGEDRVMEIVKLVVDIFARAQSPGSVVQQFNAGTK